jgi:hypothetical protein
LPTYLFSGSDDLVGQQFEGVRTMIDRYRTVGLRNVSQDFTKEGGAKCSTN